MNRSPVLIYPEGTRSLTGKLQPFKLGVGVLACELNVPVVPTHISGSYQAMPKGSWFPRPAKVRVSFGPPISPNALSPVGAGDGARDDAADESPYASYVAMVRQLRQAIEALRDANGVGT